MPVHAISKKRLAAFQKQSGRCYYCESPMWLDDPEKFAERHAISKSTALKFQCTAEHLQARCDGGSNKSDNIVAACKYCNSTRHKKKHPPTPGEYIMEIRKRLRKGKWIPYNERPLCA